MTTLPRPAPPIYVIYLNRFDVDALALTDEEILAAVEFGLLAQGRRETVIEPRTHLEPDAGQIGHFNVLRGWIGAGIGLAGVKVVSDYYNNYEYGLPSELATLLLLDPASGAPCAIIDASGLTDMRTGAMSAIGAKFLAGKPSKILANIGARGTSYWNCRLIARLLDLEEIRLHSRRRESREQLAEQLRRDLAPKIRNRRYRRLGIGSSRRRHHYRSHTPHKTGAVVENRMDQERRTGHALWHHECGGAGADRHYG